MKLSSVSGRERWPLVMVAAIGVGALLACDVAPPDIRPAGGGSADPGPARPGGDGMGGGGQGSTSPPPAPTFTLPPPPPSDPAAPPVSPSPSGNGLGEGPACASTGAIAERVPVDLYMVVDRSGSMTSATRDGRTKWVAVKQAIDSFLKQPESAGLNVGMVLYPQLAPTMCSSDADCGAFGPCAPLSRACVRPAKGSTPPQPVQACGVNGTCPTGSTCQEIGRCSADQLICAKAGEKCGPGNMGTCVVPMRCTDHSGCGVRVYSAPAVAITPIEKSGPEITRVLDATVPSGNTPTGPALLGAFEYIREHLKTAAGRRGVVVLATDGAPTACAGTDSTVMGISAAIGNQRSTQPSLSTYVIGVFTTLEQARVEPNLLSFATAGGTTKPFIINTDQDVAKSFLTALAEIRGSVQTCEYKIPAPMVTSSRTTLDYSKVNVAYAAADGKGVTVGYVSGAAACDPGKGGWHYDVDPAKGGTPATIVLCPATCAAVQKIDRGKVEVKLGCKTEFLIP